jgi:galactokinase
MSIQEQVESAFREQFGTAPQLLVRAPGRVNLIGEHTDYNDGFVLPMAIDRAVWIALRPRSDRTVAAKSLDFSGDTEFFLDDLKKTGAGWPEYLKGVAFVLQEAGHNLKGWEGVVAGDVPIGAGLSSSAAIEMAAARAFAAVSDISWDPPAMAKLGQRAENQWVGVNCGIMDQMISATGKAGHAVLIDCRSLELRQVPLPLGTRVVVLDTATRRGLVGSAYNERRAQCESAAATFGVKALRDVSVKEFKRRSAELEETTCRRARHVISEDERTLKAVEAMRLGGAETVGWLMDESHRSLRDDFEVSSLELDAMAECARSQPGCYGARMTGAGFGGCAVALIRQEAESEFVEAVARRYRRATGRKPSIYVCQATDGAQVLSISGGMRHAREMLESEPGGDGV